MGLHSIRKPRPSSPAPQEAEEDNNEEEEKEEEGAQSKVYLPCKQEALSLIPRTHIKKLSMVVHSCHLSPREAETGGPLKPTGQLVA